jgi:hypothetical protein
MEKDYLLEKVEIEEQRNSGAEAFTEYTVDEFIQAHEGEYSCPSKGTFEELYDGSIGCSVHGSIYENN